MRLWHGLSLMLVLGWLGCGAAPSSAEKAAAPDTPVVTQAAETESEGVALEAPADVKGSVVTNKQYLMKTSKGEIVLELDCAKAPKTCANFANYVAKRHYDGTIFHRVIPNFMIQGGGMNAQMVEKSTDAPVENEAANGLTNLRGTIAMARTSAVHSATSQFFINVTNNDFLNHRSPDPAGFGYCVFGKVIKGMEVVDAIKAVATGTRGQFENVPLDPVIIESVTLLP